MELFFYASTRDPFEKRKLFFVIVHSKESLTNLRFQKVLQQLEYPQKINVVKKEIAQIKIPDLNTKKIESAVRMVEGTARSMGIKVGGK